METLRTLFEKSPTRTTFIGSVVMVGLWLIVPTVLGMLFRNDWGNAGDAFGSVDALFSGVALLLVVGTLNLQLIELKAQREDSKEARQEAANMLTATTLRNRLTLLSSQVDANLAILRVANHQSEYYLSAPTKLKKLVDELEALRQEMELKADSSPLESYQRG